MTRPVKKPRTFKVWVPIRPMNNGRVRLFPLDERATICETRAAVDRWIAAEKVAGDPAAWAAYKGTLALERASSKPRKRHE
ncbi:MAG: hypothetical protein Q8R02_23370 [Hyphomonadaceae bacterium]|nr:hypothetical protein [Hyphomonadaceae bacterium]